MEGIVHTSTLLTRKEAAERLRISTITLDKLISDQKLAAVSIGRRKLISSDQIAGFIQKGGSK